MIVGMIGGFFVLAALLFLILFRKEKMKMREFYEKNGGSILEKAKIIKLFKKEELKDILKSKNLIGKGGFGENIVRLIGCCLEVDTPMLVYEFLPKGNLEDLLHSNNNSVPLSIDMRLTIAAQAADGLAYMHSQTSNKILHGDVKPANILLNDKFMPKISDFGISRLIARDKEHANNIIGLLTEKSDVYSFGVVILELISRRKATHSDDNALIRSFVEAHKDKTRVTELFDNEIALASNLELLHSLARIAVDCLNRDVDQRPSMMDVAEHLLLLNRSCNP
ncbi:hypothetical protein HU200_010013 [Digitaria exilis]|uniref:Protein kinase domain-containing protein n=1 Tax=Digitaria exilis TaxID=1010633 RepID=A0A835FKW8_9POAL|nr:hypothetical protein HU200_010013 [Digitaria exilis]